MEINEFKKVYRMLCSKTHNAKHQFLPPKVVKICNKNTNIKT
jgi:hypothetical protein